jgi:peptide/nickel transport system permease protein
VADAAIFSRSRAAPGRPESLAGMAWARFRRHRMASLCLKVVALLALACVLAPWLSGDDPAKPVLSLQLQPPSAAHPLGTDDLGRDLLTRILYGGRVSMSIGVLAMSLAVVIGTTVGALAGYYGGWTDNVLMRITDLMLSIPTLFLLILLMLLLRSFPIPFLRGGVLAIVMTIALLSWMTVARLVRASYLSLKAQVYVEAARALGASHARIIVRHILPNAVSAIIVAATDLGQHAQERAGPDDHGALDGDLPRRVHLHHRDRDQLRRRRAAGRAGPAARALGPWPASTGAQLRAYTG